MKIECTTEELVALQRTTELESLQYEVVALRERNSSLEDRIANLKDHNTDLQRELVKPAATINGASMQQVSDLFKVYLGGANRETPIGAQKIAAIKAVREVFKCGLREAKFIIEGNLENERYG